MMTKQAMLRRFRNLERRHGKSITQLFTIANSVNRVVSEMRQGITKKDRHLLQIYMALLTEYRGQLTIDTLMEIYSHCTEALELGAQVNGDPAIRQLCAEALEQGEADRKRAHAMAERMLKREWNGEVNALGRIESKALADYWLRHPHRRQYEGLDLVPNGPALLAGNRLNLWRGWGVEPRRGSWRLIRRHIAEVLANGNQEFEDFILIETAWKLQTPAYRLRLCWHCWAGKALARERGATR
jgi:hypothetical protein